MCDTYATLNTNVGALLEAAELPLQLCAMCDTNSSLMAWFYIPQSCIFGQICILLFPDVSSLDVGSVTFAAGAVEGTEHGGGHLDSADLLGGGTIGTVCVEGLIGIVKNGESFFTQVVVLCSSSPEDKEVQFIKHWGQKL
jgi:hypothetical protein